jgi:hypothetical protein
MYKVTLHDEFYVKAEDEEAAAWNALEGLDINILFAIQVKGPRLKRWLDILLV